MSTQSIFREIRRTLTSWKKLKEEEVPHWVVIAYTQWIDNLNIHPYNTQKIFVGKNNLYKIVHGSGKQGEAPITGWYITRRIR